MEKLELKPFSKEISKTLVSRGVSYGDFIRTRETFDAVRALISYDTDIPRVMPKSISRQKQCRGLEKVLENPTRANYVMGISSFPSDARAKHLAIQILKVGCEHWARRKALRTGTVGRSMPYWHRVFGGFNDDLRDRKLDERPCMLVISNVNAASSAYKLEKVRDILEQFNDIPRIVVMSGLDPTTFFATRLYYPINLGIQLGPDNRIEE
jgi:hypothetical protein